MTRRVSYGRVIATSPGKHGPRDWRVTFAGSAPTLGEAVALVGMLCLAEDRYAGPGQMGRYMFWYFVDRLLLAKSPEAVVEVAEDCDGAKDAPPRRQTVAAAAGPPTSPRPSSAASYNPGGSP